MNVMSITFAPWIRVLRLGASDLPDGRRRVAACSAMRRTGLAVMMVLLAGCAGAGKGAGESSSGVASRSAAADPVAHPDDQVTAAVALKVGRGAPDQRLAGSLEEAFLRQFPNAQWVSGDRKVDLIIDLTVHDAKQEERPFQKQNRRCRRYSNPGANAKTTLQKILTTQCVDWQVDTESCLARRYEIDLQVRGRTPEGRLVVSDRRLLKGERSDCGDSPPSAASLRSEVEEQVGPWVMGLLGPRLRSISQSASSGGTPIQGSARPSMSGGAGESPGPASPPAILAQPPVLSGTGLQTTQDKAPIQAIKAHALVVGNGAYAGSALLANPVNDARAIASRLETLGFRVTRVENADRPSMVKALTQFRAAAAQADLTLLFYAGHGVQVDGMNDLLPVDIAPADASSLRLQGVPVDEVIDGYLPGRTRVVFLDACRDNPFASSGSRGQRRGLAPMNVPQGTLIAFAAKDGGTAEDGTGQRHSPFTAALLEHLDDPQDIVIVLRQVREKVMRATQGRQQPWDYGSLTGGSLVLSRVAAPR